MKKQKRILVTGAGGTPSTNFIRSLREAPEDFYIVGADADKYYLLRSEADTNYLVPYANDPCFLSIINKIITQEQVDFVHIQNDTEMLVFSEQREGVDAKLYLPAKETVRVCQDKFKSYRAWQEHGLTVPKTMMINSVSDLETALETLGGGKGVWLRATTGAGGRGSLPTNDLESGRTWIDFHKGWGSFTAAEMLNPETVTWSSIWDKGELVVAQGRKRLYWELSKLTPSGVTGVTGGGAIINDPQLDDIALKAIRSIDPEPHGIFSVDLAYNKALVPNPTEINIGRFFTTHQYFTELGLNLPYFLVKLAYNESVPPLKKKISPIYSDKIWIRGVDFEPVLKSSKELERYEKQLERMRKESV